MIREDVVRLLRVSREARWTFPTSSGRPIGRTSDEAVERLVARRQSLIDAARFFLETGDVDSATEIAANIWRLWILSRDALGGRAFLAQVLDVPSPKTSRARALALYGDGLLAFRQGAYEDSRRRNEAALENARASGDPEALALANLGLSRVALNDGDCERSCQLAVKAREFARALGPAMGQAPLHMHAQSLWLAGHLDEAARLFGESLDLNRKIGDDGMVVVELHNLGHVEARRGNADTAERLFDECAQRDSSSDPYSAATRELNAATVAYGRGDRVRARELLTRAEAILLQAGLDPAAKSEIRWLREHLSGSVS